MQAKLNWWDVALQGTSAYEFDRQIKDLQAYLRRGWQTTTSARTGNPVYVTPSVLILYRADQQFVLEPIIPQQGQRHHAYDLVIASQPFRARLPADIKVRNVACAARQRSDARRADDHSTIDGQRSRHGDYPQNLA